MTCPCPCSPAPGQRYIAVGRFKLPPAQPHVTLATFVPEYLSHVCLQLAELVARRAWRRTTRASYDTPEAQSRTCAPTHAPFVNIDSKTLTMPSRSIFAGAQHHQDRYARSQDRADSASPNRLEQINPQSTSAPKLLLVGKVGRYVWWLSRSCRKARNTVIMHRVTV